MTCPQSPGSLPGDAPPTRVSDPSCHLTIVLGVLQRKPTCRPRIG